MGDKAQPRAGLVLPATGMLFLGIAAAGLAAGPNLEPIRLWFAVTVGVAGAGMTLWGGARLRRARAARPDLSWWKFLRSELVAFALAAALLPAWTALPPGQRDGLVHTAREWFELIHVARGRH